MKSDHADFGAIEKEQLQKRNEIQSYLDNLFMELTRNIRPSRFVIR